MHSALLVPYGDLSPQVDPTAWIAPGVVLTGEVVIGAHTTVLFNCVMRGDINRIEIGAGSNIQDLTMCHVADEWPCMVGREVTVGHCALLHGCVVEDGCLIGMGARLLNGCRIGRGSIVAAGALVPERMQIPPGMFVAGLPAQVKGPVTEAMLAKLGALEAAAPDMRGQPGGAAGLGEVDDDSIPDDLRGLPGVAFARKYRRVAEAYRGGRRFRPGTARR
jgi:carbonic anhydrase/acetyltransferase-like protein (isoleucine patch superfamily)